MAYSEFTLERAINELALTLNSTTNLFASVPSMPLSPSLIETLAEYVPLAIAIHTEKARSEMIVAPVLVEVRKQVNRRISLFSGTEFNVAPEQGLNGVCDFIVSRSPEQRVLTAPAFVIVEAKKDNVQGGLGQCAAAMVAAQIFNARAATRSAQTAQNGQAPGPNAEPPIYGLVTTGSIWQFLRLNGTILYVDQTEHYLDQIEKIYGILFAIADGTAP